MENPELSTTAINDSQKKRKHTEECNIYVGESEAPVNEIKTTSKDVSFVRDFLKRYSDYYADNVKSSYIISEYSKYSDTGKVYRCSGEPYTEFIDLGNGIKRTLYSVLENYPDIKIVILDGGLVVRNVDRYSRTICFLPRKAMLLDDFQQIAGAVEYENIYREDSKQVRGHVTVYSRESYENWMELYKRMRGKELEVSKKQKLNA